MDDDGELLVNYLHGDDHLVVRVELILRLHLGLQLLVGGLQLGVVPVDRLDLVVRKVVVSGDHRFVVVYLLVLSVCFLGPVRGFFSKIF